MYNIIQIYQNNEWKEFNVNLFEVKEYITNRKHTKTYKIYYENNEIDKIKYICSQCNNKIVISSKSFIKKIIKNEFLCQKCSMKKPEIRQKISEQTKKSMDNPELKKHLSEMQKQRWERPEEIERRKIISKEKTDLLRKMRRKTFL